MTEFKEFLYKILNGEIPDNSLDTLILFDDIELNALALTFMKKYTEAMNFVKKLAEGDLSENPPAKNLIASPFKMLHSSLKHLTWQTQQVAKGDLSQQVHFLGDFSDAFNQMIEALKEKRKIEEALRENEKRLSELNATKDKFFSIIAHDLKGPMGALNSITELMNSDFDSFSEEEKKEFIQLIAESSKNTLGLLHNLLDWSRQQMGKIPFQPEKINISSIIQNNIDILKLLADKKNIRLEKNCRDDLICLADANMITTVCRNLISNAIKFTPDNGSIQISAESKDLFAVLSVKDSGLGISENDMKKLFRIDVHHTTKGTKDEGGTGLGLIMCKEFVEKNGGTIRVESQLGEGSTFIFTIPLYIKEI